MSSLFKKPKRSVQQRSVHDKNSSDEKDSEDELTKSAIQEMRVLKSLRKRSSGVSIEDLASVKPKVKQPKNNDTQKLQGGFIDVKALKREISQADDLDQIGTGFAAETNRRDEDADMLAYVEEELAKHKGQKKEEETNNERSKNPLDALYELPDHIKALSNRKKTEEMLSNQMLSGIPEVDLGIEVKIKNIEATEDAKQRLIKERKNRKDGVSEFVPSNIAVNFVQHNRYNIEDTSAPVKRVAPTPKPTPLRVGDADRPRTLQDGAATLQSQGVDKATDDFHFEKFKRHMRRF